MLSSKQTFTLRPAPTVVPRPAPTATMIPVRASSGPYTTQRQATATKVSLAGALVAGALAMSDVEPARNVSASNFVAPDYASKPDYRL